jgi:hypothetical protein
MAPKFLSQGGGGLRSGPEGVNGVAAAPLTVSRRVR